MLLSAEGVYKLFFCSRGAIFLFASDFFIFIRLSRFLSFNMWTSSHVGNENVGRKEREKDIKRKYARRKRQKKKNATFMQNRKLSVQLKETEQVNVKTKRPGGFQTLPFRRMCFFWRESHAKKRSGKFLDVFTQAPASCMHKSAIQGQMKYLVAHRNFGVCLFHQLFCLSDSIFSIILVTKYFWWA